MHGSLSEPVVKDFDLSSMLNRIFIGLTTSGDSTFRKTVNEEPVSPEENSGDKGVDSRSGTVPGEAMVARTGSNI